MREFEKAGSVASMKTRRVVAGSSHGQTWESKRRGFVARHMAQYRTNPTYRRWLALVMWAYMPGPAPQRKSPKSSRSRVSGKRGVA